MVSSLGHTDTFDYGIVQSEWCRKGKLKYIEKGLFVDDGGDMGSGGTYDNGHFGYLEGVVMYRHTDPASVRARRQFLVEEFKACVDEKLGIPIHPWGGHNRELGPHAHNYHEWVQKIRKKLDPNSAADSWTLE